MASAVSRLVTLRRRVLLLAIVLVVGVLVHGLLFFAVSVRIGSGPEEVAEEPWIGWSGTSSAPTDPVMQEQSLLLDAEPLFVPTPWNAASALDDIARLRDETELFAAFPPRLGESERIWAPPSALDESDLLEARMAGPVDSSPFRRMGTEPPLSGTRTPASPVPAMLEIRDLATGRPLGSPQPFVADGVVPPRTLWNPLEFLLFVDDVAGGGLPLLLNSSGSPEWDRSVAQALLRTPRLAQLPQGYFRIVVGP